MSTIFIDLNRHMGLGDAIVCNGMIRHILEVENSELVYVPVLNRNYVSVSRMFTDEPRIKCLPMNYYRDIYNLPQYKTSDKRYRPFNKPRWPWDSSMYQSMDIDFEFRWSKSKIYRDLEKEKKLEAIVNPTNEPFVLIHNTGSNVKFDIQVETNLKIITVSPITEDIFDWCGMIEKASDIHCIDSSFIHLCQSLGVSGTFHFFNSPFRYGRFNLLPTWKRIDH